MFFHYDIPKEIKSKIPEYFYYAFGGELLSIFGKDFLTKDDSSGNYPLDFLSSTNGYSVAFDMTCRKLDMMWLKEYRDSLPYYDSDLFDGEIDEQVIRVFKKSKEANSYYLYLIGKAEDAGERRD